MQKLLLVLRNRDSSFRQIVVPTDLTHFQLWQCPASNMQVRTHNSYSNQKPQHHLISFVVRLLTAKRYSLTHCCAWPAEGRSVLHIERSWPTIQAAPTDRPMSSSTCCSQFLRGRPGRRFQSAVGGVPVWASIDSCSACEAGVLQ